MHPTPHLILLFYLSQQARQNRVWLIHTNFFIALNKLLIHPHGYRRISFIILLPFKRMNYIWYWVSTPLNINTFSDSQQCVELKGNTARIFISLDGTYKVNEKHQHLISTCAADCQPLNFVKNLSFFLLCSNKQHEKDKFDLLFISEFDQLKIS